MASVLTLLMKGISKQDRCLYNDSKAQLIEMLLRKWGIEASRMDLAMSEMKV